jgi:succinate dehydrogenase/fumarate reductase flavoprotein subunit
MAPDSLFLPAPVNPTQAVVIKATKDICELRNMINVGYLITRQALERKESCGLHYTIDYPKKTK